MRTLLTLSMAALAVASCSGPIVSERFVLQEPTHAYQGTAHGVYCLPKQYFSLTVNDVSEDATKQKLNIAVSVTTGPDFDHLYRLGFDESWLSNDTIAVSYVKSSTDAQGTERPASCLLANITSDVTDATPAIVKSLTQIVFSLSTGKVPVTTSGATEHKNLNLKQVFEVSPSKNVLERTVDGINQAFRDSGFRLKIKIEFIGASAFDAALLENPDQDLGGKNWGVFGRIAQPYRLSLYGPSITEGKKRTGPLNRLLDERIVYSHNGLQPFFVKINRSAFVQRKTTIDFTGGYPTKIETDKKSEMAAFANIPLDIVTAIVGAPVAALESDAALVRKQGELIDEQQKLIEARKALDAERAKGNSPQGTDPGASSN